MKKKLILIGILALLVGVPVLNKLFRGEHVKAVYVEKLSLRSIKSSILASGKLTHEEKAVLSPEIVGKVKTIFVKEGDTTRKGQLVLQIDDQEPSAEVTRNIAMTRMQEIEIERQKLRVERQQLQWERNKKLFEANQISRDLFESSTLELSLAKVDLKSTRESLSQAQAQLQQAKNRLEKTRIHSPINGVVTSVDIKPGETAIPGSTNIPGSTLLTIANPKSIYTEVNVDEADIANIQIGNKVEIVAIAHQKQPLPGTVESIASSAKIAEGRQGLSFAVKIRLTNPGNLNLLPGMSCRAEIYTRSKENVAAIPIKSILLQEDTENNTTKHYVFVNRNHTAQKILITPGIADDEYQEIVKGLRLGDEVILGPDKILQHLNQGDSLKIN